MKHVLKTKDKFDFNVYVNDKECPLDHTGYAKTGLSFWTRYRNKWINLKGVFCDNLLLEEVKEHVETSSLGELNDMLEKEVIIQFPRS
jgi:hypothetical protein